MTYKTHISMALGISSIPFSLPLISENGKEILQSIFEYIFKESDKFFQYENLSFLDESIKTIFLLSLFFIFIIIGSLLPDIDHKNAKINKIIENKLLNYKMLILYGVMSIIVFLPQILRKINIDKAYIYYLSKINEYMNNFMFINLIYSFMLIIVGLLILKYIGQNFNHRGPTHSLLLQSIIFIPIIVLYNHWINIIIIPLYIGSMLHVFSDMFTKSGVSILNPIINYNFRFLPKSLCIKTGTSSETLFYFIPFSLLTVFNYFQLIIILK